MNCGGCSTATLRRAAFDVSSIVRDQFVVVGCGDWGDGVGGNGCSAQQAPSGSSC
jgi:hypothetical protein